MGVIDLKVQNEALLLKNLHKFFNKENLPWVNLIWDNYYKNGKLPSATKKGSFWWRDILKLLDLYKEMAMSNIFSGAATFLWDDMWNGLLPKLCFPELYSFTKNKSISLQKARSLSHLHNIFHLPLSEEAFAQYIELQNLLSNLPDSTEADSWSYIWGASFSCSKAYKQLKGHFPTHPSYKWLWKSCCQLKHKIFFWLLLKDRLSTRGLLKRRNMFLEDYNCAICGEEIEETLEHLFLHCNFASQCWTTLNVESDLNLDPLQILDRFRSILQVPFFMEIIILMSWSIWVTRNALIFDAVAPTVQSTIEIFKYNFAMVIHRAKRKYAPLMSIWLENYNLS